MGIIKRIKDSTITFILVIVLAGLSIGYLGYLLGSTHFDRHTSISVNASDLMYYREWQEVR